MAKKKTPLRLVADRILLADLRLRVEHPSVEDACLGALHELAEARYDLNRQIRKLKKLRGLL